jgi:predicted amidohydrolase YtcJ
MAIPEDNLDPATACGFHTGFGGDWLRLGPVKIFADGALGSQTASMLEPFEGQPLNNGIATHNREELIELVGRAVKAGFWCAIHAIGDRANQWTLDAYEAHWGDSQKAQARHRIEHVQLLHPNDLDRLGRLQVIASMQPIHATSDREIAERYWGRRSRFAYAWRSLRARGARLAFGSDAPVESPDVFQGLYAAVTRRRAHEREGRAWYPEEAISVGEALEAYTAGAAYAAGEETRSGRLTPGHRADFVVLDRSILAGPAEVLLQTRVESTIVGGELVYTAPTFTA